MFICCLLNPLKINASDKGSQEPLSPDTNVFLITSPSGVPPGSLVQITLQLLFKRYFFKKSICVDLPEPSPPSKVTNKPLLTLTWYDLLLFINQVSV